MSNPRELRERFKRQPDGNKPSGCPESRSNVSEILGLTAAQDMKDAITGDIEAMIEKGYRSALEGYVLCLSRIISHDTAWEYILEAFRNKNEHVPGKYYKQFGKNPKDIIPPKKGMSVQ